MLSTKVATIIPASGNECQSQCFMTYSLFLLAYFVFGVFMGISLTNSRLEYITLGLLVVFLLL